MAEGLAGMSSTEFAVYQQRAQAAARRALREGLLRMPLACEACGRERKLVLHHHDYDLPLAVVAVCYSCHRLIHEGRIVNPLTGVHHDVPYPGWTPS